MAEQGWKSLSVSESIHARTLEDAARSGNLKIFAMVAAYQRGWRMLTPEQQMLALRTDLTEVELGLICERRGDLRIEVNRLQRGALCVDEEADRALADGRIDAGERRLLNELLRKTVAQAERVAAAVRKNNEQTGG